MVSAAEQQNYAKYSNFMDARQQHMALQILKEQHCERFCFYGGYEGSERNMLCVYPDYLTEEDLDFPCDSLVFHYPKAYTLSHRDFLGAIMSTQIKREMLGDILVSEGLAVVLVQRELTDYLLNNLDKIGRVGVRGEKAQQCPLNRQQKFEEISGTVASLRIDSIVALATRLSRGKAVELISAGRVALNYEEVLSPSVGVNPEDLISIRGYGKYLLTSEIHVTKKNRCHIMIQKFI